MDPLTDVELDHLIELRLRQMEIDLSVLPEEDARAPADRRRVLAAVRRLLRDQMPVVADLALDPITWPPILYPSGLAAADGRIRGTEVER